MKTVFKSASKAVLLSLLAAGLAAEPGARTGSLWPTTGGGEQSMFADRKAGHKGDILTVEVAESAAATNSQSKKTARANTLEDALGQFFFSNVGAHSGQLPILKLSGSSSNSGGGEVANTQSLTSRAAVLVTDVLPNGNLAIEGVRVVTFSGETQYVVLHGIVRPDDITAANTITSSNIADARVEFVAEGNLTEAQKRGWFSKLYDKLRPF